MQLNAYIHLQCNAIVGGYKLPWNERYLNTYLSLNDYALSDQFMRACLCKRALIPEQIDTYNWSFRNEWSMYNKTEYKWTRFAISTTSTLLGHLNESMTYSHSESYLNSIMLGNTCEWESYRTVFAGYSSHHIQTYKCKQNYSLF